MGYAPDPTLSALNAYRLATHLRTFQGVIAWIDATPSRMPEAGSSRTLGLDRTALLGGRLQA